MRILVVGGNGTVGGSTRLVCRSCPAPTVIAKSGGVAPTHRNPGGIRLSLTRHVKLDS